jgi:hypothetical protein
MLISHLRGTDRKSNVGMVFERAGTAAATTWVARQPPVAVALIAYHAITRSRSGPRSPPTNIAYLTAIKLLDRKSGR